MRISVLKLVCFLFFIFYLIYSNNKWLKSFGSIFNDFFLKKK